MLQISGYNRLRDTNLKTPLFSRNASSSNCGKLSALLLLLLLLLLLPDTVTIGSHPQVKILCTTPDFRQHPQKRPSDQLSTKNLHETTPKPFPLSSIVGGIPVHYFSTQKQKNSDFFLATGRTSFSALYNTKKPLSCS
jgi:hypothetical protein